MRNAETISDCMEQIFAVRQQFTARFYRRLFDELPAARHMFIHDPRRQEMMLFAGLSMVMKGLDSGRNMYGEMFEFGRVHRRVGVREEMFPVFGAVFLEVLVEFLPESDHPGLAQAWWKTYTVIYEAIIDGMRSESAAKTEARRLFSGATAHVA